MGRVDPFTNNPETKATLNMLKYNPSAMLQEIKELKSSHLYKSAEPDDNSRFPGEVWQFKKLVKGHLIYIKLKIKDINGFKKLFVMSFHLDR